MIVGSCHRPLWEDSPITTQGTLYAHTDTLQLCSTTSLTPVLAPL